MRDNDDGGGGGEESSPTTDPNDEDDGDAQSDFPTKGITLQGIKHFISLHGGEEAFSGLRTTDVCDRFLKPSTVDHQESYCLQG